jgi:hypothetical protein
LRISAAIDPIDIGRAGIDPQEIGAAKGSRTTRGKNSDLHLIVDYVVNWIPIWKARAIIGRPATYCWFEVFDISLDPDAKVVCSKYCPVWPPGQ